MINFVEKLFLIGVFTIFEVCAVRDLPDGSCAIEGMAYNMQDNIIQIVNDISSITECRILCHDEQSCTYMTFYGPESFPFSDTCVLYSSCEELFSCDDCKTEDSSCLPVEFQLCSSAVESDMGDNLLHFLPNIEDEAECKGECTAQTGCLYYTYHNLSDPGVPGGCFLLSKLDLTVPLQTCQHCMTGPLDCTKRCFFFVNGDTATTSKLLLTNTTSPIPVTAVGLGGCDLTSVAVGAGGSSGTGGGGGSGYIEYNTWPVVGMVQLEATVAKCSCCQCEQSSFLTLNGQEVLRAQPGQKGNSRDGGNGYSGGGAYGSGGGGDGGMDGGNGQGRSGLGGKGSGLKVSDIPVEDFNLSPGQGGDAHGYNPGYGGYGGGLLVDGRTSCGSGSAGGYSGAGASGCIVLVFK